MTQSTWLAVGVVKKLNPLPWEVQWKGKNYCFKKNYCWCLKTSWSVGKHIFYKNVSEVLKYASTILGQVDLLKGENLHSKCIQTAFHILATKKSPTGSEAN